MDDMWNIDAWEKVKFSFPNENNGSGIIITSRISNIAMDLTGGHGREMNFLNEDISWSLLCKIVFGEGGCPLELEATAKKIARNCKGLPLSFVVIGGLLAKSNWTREYWEYIAENLNSIVNLENDAHCLNVLYLSYNHLSVLLKPCFLYFGVFHEDHEILVSELMELWVAEGFLKPISGKSLEEVAEEYLKELYDRNLILVSDWECNGYVKSFRIHDLLRDLCLREAEKEKFLCVTGQHIHSSIPQGLNTCRRIALHNDISKKEEFVIALQSASYARSLITIFDYGVSKSQNFRLLRLLTTYDELSLDAIFSQLVNLRLVNINININYSTVVSAKHIHDEQKDCGNEGLHFQVLVTEHHKQLRRSWASSNFIVEVFSIRSPEDADHQRPGQLELLEVWFIIWYAIFLVNYQNFTNVYKLVSKTPLI